MERKVNAMRSSLRGAALIGLTVLASLPTGCANTGPGSLGDTLELRRDIVWYYERKAWERNATCLQPKMSITDMRLLEETAERLVFDIRYIYDDPSYGRRSNDGLFGGPFGGGLGVPGNACFGSGERTFVVSKRQGGGYDVASMTGPQRN